MDIRVSALTEKYGWSHQTLSLAIETKFCCAYCDVFLLESVDTYYQFNVDHIVPSSRGGSDDPSNLTIACRTCNYLKRTYNPIEHLAPGATRAELIAEARRRVQAERAEKSKKVRAEKEAALEILQATPNNSLQARRP